MLFWWYLSSHFDIDIMIALVILRFMLVIYFRYISQHGIFCINENNNI